MTLFQELKEFIKAISHSLYAFLGFSIFFFSFGLKKVVLFGASYLVPLPSSNTFAVFIFNRIEHDLLPQGVHLVVTSPLSGFISQVVLSLLLALVPTFPFFLYKMIQYLSPALFEHEKKAVMKFLVPLVALFIAGALFAYFVIIPLTFKLLFPYATSIGATPFFGVDEFINSVVSLMVATGVMFLLPLCMILLSFIGLVDGDFWKTKRRYALLFFLIFSAIITPDGTGVTMVLLFVPLALLYEAGCLCTRKFYKRN